MVHVEQTKSYEVEDQVHSVAKTNGLFKRRSERTFSCFLYPTRVDGGESKIEEDKEYMCMYQPKQKK